MARRKEVVSYRVPTSARKAFRRNILGRGVAARVERLSVGRMKNALRNWLYDVAVSAFDDSDLESRTGRLERDINNKRNYVVTGTRIDTIKGTIYGTDQMIGQEYGGNIKPKKSDYLTLPLPPALKKNGTPIFRDSRKWKRYGSFTWKSRKGYLFIARKRGSDLVLLYRLVKKVKLKPALGIRKMAVKKLPRLLRIWEGILTSSLMTVGLTLWPNVEEGYRKARTQSRIRRIGVRRVFRLGRV